jgi:hypothetical protein
MSLLPPEIYERIIADALHLEQLPYRTIMSNVFTQIRDSNHTFTGRCGHCHTNIYNNINISSEINGNTIYILNNNIALINNNYDYFDKSQINHVRIFCSSCIPYSFGIY